MWNLPDLGGCNAIGMRVVVNVGDIVKLDALGTSSAMMQPYSSLIGRTLSMGFDHEFIKQQKLILQMFWVHYMDVAKSLRIFKTEIDMFLIGKDVKGYKEKTEWD